jgi:hypothetical protein
MVDVTLTRAGLPGLDFKGNERMSDLRPPAWDCRRRHAGVSPSAFRRPYRFQVVSPSNSPQQNMPMSAATMKKSNSVKYSKIADMACSSYFLRWKS